MNENRATVQASDGGQVNVQLTPKSQVSLGSGRNTATTATTNFFSLLRLQAWTST